MYTSCGWFFDDISGIEATQVIQYAGRVIQLAQKLFGVQQISQQFLEMLSQAKSNIPEKGDGRAIYESAVQTAAVDLGKVAAHYAVSSLFEDYAEDTSIYCYKVSREEYELQTEGAAQMAVGRAKLTSVITRESDETSFGVLHFGDHNITAGVRRLQSEDAYAAMKTEAFAAFRQADLPETIRVLDRHFGELTYSLRTLFRDEQRKVLGAVLASTVGEAEASYRQIYEHHGPLMRYLMDIGVPMPPSFQAAAELVINVNLRRVLEEAPIDAGRLADHLADAKTWAINLDEAGLAFAARNTLEQLAIVYERNPDDRSALKALEASSAGVKLLPFVVDLSEVQNRFWNVLQECYPDYAKRAARTEADAIVWMEHFRRLSANLNIRVD
jgi:hypothetical protein